VSTGTRAFQVTTGARPTPVVTPRPSPIAQGVRSAIKQGERANPASRYNQRRMDQIMRDNNVPRLRPDRMTETVDSCPVPPRFNVGNSRPDTIRFLNNVRKTIEELSELGILGHTPVPLVPSNQLWPTRTATPSSATSGAGTISAEEFRRLCESGVPCA